MDSLILFYFLLVSFLYSSVGHGGATGYILVMSLMGIVPNEIKSTALILNIVVSGISFIRFRKEHKPDSKLFTLLIASSAPMALLGGIVLIESLWYKQLLGIILILASIKFLFPKLFKLRKKPVVKPNIFYISLTGASLGFISGLSGIGGGIFLSPLVLYFGWADVKKNTTLSAGFIFVNSIFGLLGLFYNTFYLTSGLPLAILVSIVGSYIGALLGSKILNQTIIVFILGFILLIAGTKLILVI